MGPSPVDEALAQAAAAMEAKQYDQASAIYQQVMQHEPDNADAVAGLCRALLALGHADDVRQLIEALDEELSADPKIVSVKTQLELLAEGGGDTAALEAKVAADGKDHEARLELAKAYAAAYRVLATSDLADRLPAITAPTLVATGEHDVGSNTRMARLMHERIAGSVLHIFPGMKHSILAEVPDAIADRLRTFLAG